MDTTKHAGPEPAPVVAVLGGGQLGLMLGEAAGSLGLRCTFIDPNLDAPAASVGALTVAELGDIAALSRAVTDAEVITYEWEGVPAATAHALGASGVVRPNARALETAQDRVAEKQLFGRLGIAVAPFAAIDDQADLEAALHAVGLPAILKTRRGGYDGKGQRSITTAAALEAAWDALGRRGLVLEARVPFDRELSILAARDVGGATCSWPLVENHHVGGVLAVSRAPAPKLSVELQRRAEDLAGRVLDELEYVGVLAVELFECDGQLLANELAPRVHNSGHWTIEGSATSQFTQHLRAITGRSLGSTAVFGYAAMVNCLGVIPPVERVTAVEGATLHNYHKTPRAGRKVGHITIVAPSPEAREQRLVELADRIPGLVPPPL
jgi:5-(carboxyamino)imidazole ribonucleotide synthase